MPIAARTMFTENHLLKIAIGMLLLCAVVTPSRSLGETDEKSYHVNVSGACLVVPNALRALGPSELKAKEQQIRDAAAPRPLDEELMFYATGQLSCGSWIVALFRRYPHLMISQENVRLAADRGVPLIERAFRQDLEAAGRPVVWRGTRPMRIGHWSAFLLDYESRLKTGHLTRNVRVVVPDGPNSIELMVTATSGPAGYPNGVIDSIVQSLRPC